MRALTLPFPHCPLLSQAECHPAKHTSRPAKAHADNAAWPPRQCTVFHYSYLAGDTAETSALTDEFPELAALRDVVFFSKLLLVPAADALPDVRPWRLQDSALQWSFSAQDRRLVVLGFAQTLDPSVGAAALAAAEQQKEKGGFGYRNAVFTLLFGSNVKPRCPPSGANPSVLAGSVVDTEEDVLHLKKLPDFDGTLRASDSELLLSYLTAPYLRIPLLLRFFATPERVSSLGSRELQSVLHSAVFEPGARMPPGPRTSPATAPDMERSGLATACGLLFNELACSPAAAAACVGKLLELSLDLDLGKWSDVSSRIVLFAVRLAVHVETFMLFLLRHAEWRASHSAIPVLELDLNGDGGGAGGAAGGVGVPEVPTLWGERTWATIVRGLDLAPGAAEELREGLAKLRGLLEGRASMIMERYLAQARSPALFFFGISRLSCASPPAPRRAPAQREASRPERNVSCVKNVIRRRCWRSRSCGRAPSTATSPSSTVRGAYHGRARLVSAAASPAESRSAEP